MRRQQAVCGDAATLVDDYNVAITSHTHVHQHACTTWLGTAQHRAARRSHCSLLLATEASSFQQAVQGVVGLGLGCCTTVLPACQHQATVHATRTQSMTQVTAQAALPRQTWRDTHHHPGQWMCLCDTALAGPVSHPLNRHHRLLPTASCCGCASTPAWQDATHNASKQKTPNGPATGAGLKTKLLQPVLGQLNDQGIQTAAARSHPNCPNWGCSCLWTLQLPWPARSAAAADLKARLTRTPPACCLLKTHCQKR